MYHCADRVFDLFSTSDNISSSCLVLFKQILLLLLQGVAGNARQVFFTSLSDRSNSLSYVCRLDRSVVQLKILNLLLSPTSESTLSPPSIRPQVVKEFTTYLLSHDFYSLLATAINAIVRPS